jgi:hypothetical protein
MLLPINAKKQKTIIITGISNEQKYQFQLPLPSPFPREGHKNQYLFFV